MASVGVVTEWPLATLTHLDAEVTTGTRGVEVLLAYIDPGVAGFVIVSVLGFISSVGYLARSYVGRVKRRLFGNEESHAASNADDEAANC